MLKSPEFYFSLGHGNLDATLCLKTLYCQQACK